MQRHHNILTSLFLVLATVVALASCAGDDDLCQDVARRAIAFAPVESEQEAVTRAGRTLGHDFVVYGYKRLGDESQAVFDGYTVSYGAGTANTSDDNTHDYHYAGGEQTIKYWDMDASEYHFWGVWAETDARELLSGDDSNVVTIPDVPLRVGDPAPEDGVLYSQLAVRCPVSEDVVHLAFKRPYAKIRIQFYTEEPIASAADNIELTGISLAPDATAMPPLVNKVYGRGNVVVTYPLVADNCGGSGRETVEVDNLSMPQDELAFDAVTLTPELGVSVSTAVTAPIDESEGLRLDDMPGTSLKAPRREAGEVAGRKYYYYPLPMGEKNPDFTLRLTINGEIVKTAIVPAVLMQWRPNVLYTYIFKISGVSKKVELYDVKVEPWQYGGSQEETWTNW